MVRFTAGRSTALALFLLGVAGVVSPLASQDAASFRRLLPGRMWLPTFHPGPRDPVNRAELLYVTENPSLMGDGVEAELSVGITLPVLVIAGRSRENALTVGVEGGAFARFGLQRTERELVNTDWVFAVPIVWQRGDHWLRLRYYHTSSHLGDEYARRFELDGVNFARDAVELLGFARVLPLVVGYAASRWAYSVHPEASGRWVVRGGLELGDPGGSGFLLPFASLDAELDEENDWQPRWYARGGAWISDIGGRRAIRLSVGFLTGPSPLGQLQGARTTQVSLGIEASL
ncbi:MAG: hypothetical protein AMS20_10905 [Gemmatimonas sp. SG8_28]|nr:MAG: hypothetical protein AMS20_10905 [Gemmatimonas sp. SG8_28]